MHILLGAGASLWLNIPSVNAHLAAWHKGMYCIDVSRAKISFVFKIDSNPVDTQGVDAGVVDYNSAAAVTPLYQLTKSDWWCESLIFWLNPLT